MKKMEIWILLVMGLLAMNAEARNIKKCAPEVSGVTLRSWSADYDYYPNTFASFSMQFPGQQSSQYFHNMVTPTPLGTDELVTISPNPLYFDMKAVQISAGVGGAGGKLKFKSETYKFCFYGKTILNDQGVAIGEISIAMLKL